MDTEDTVDDKPTEVFTIRGPSYKQYNPKGVDIDDKVDENDNMESESASIQVMSESSENINDSQNESHKFSGIDDRFGQGNQNDNDPDQENRDNSRLSGSRSQSRFLPSQQGRALLLRTPAESRQQEHPPTHGNEGNEEPNVLITELRGNERDSWEIESDEADDKPRSHSVLDSASESDDEDYDTDLEIEEDETSGHDPTGRSTYGKMCEKLGVIPASYFVRHCMDSELSMRYHGLGPLGTRAIARVLRDNVSLEKLDLSGNWMEGDGGKAMARALEDNDYILDLTLADNRLGSRGAQHFSRILSNNAAVRKINLSGNNFDEDDGPCFAEAIEENRNLQELVLSHNGFGLKAGQLIGPAIGANETLESIDLSWNHIRLKGAVAVAKGVKENVRLKTCNLSWNGLAREGGFAIADAILANNVLLELDISGNRLDADCALKIAKALSGNDSLRTLKMGNNPITTTGAIALAKAINGNDSSVLVFLDLSDIPVEYEFLQIVKDITSKRQFRVLHGPVLRSGNTARDIGKMGVDPNTKDPLVVLKEHIVVNDKRILDILKTYDPNGTFTVKREQFAEALEELGVPYSKDQLEEISRKLDKKNNGTIYYGDYVNQDFMMNEDGTKKEEQSAS
ncbi:unnamed protein product [Owenia fusiformis]|uniref:Uncharacterized protein n=1 Tax=Owenia fusiformis TaxID=6347 RepID=A0A8J1U639_OWEFU|nr:unnamed protein product [Owenia fusiformis]